MKLTHQRLLEALDYDKETGAFYHRETKTCVKAGHVAGSRNDGNYQRIYIDGVSYKAHYLAWFYVTGEWPSSGMLDHKDLDKRNNSFANLRPANRILNGANVGLKSHNTSGLKGVSWYRQTGKWRAQIQVAGKKRALGYFDTKEEAHAAYVEAANAAFGEFARAA
jgi:hypothetical protein